MNFSRYQPRQRLLGTSGLSPAEKLIEALMLLGLEGAALFKAIAPFTITQVITVFIAYWINFGSY